MATQTQARGLCTKWGMEENTQKLHHLRSPTWPQDMEQPKSANPVDHFNLHSSEGNPCNQKHLENRRCHQAQIGIKK